MDFIGWSYDIAREQSPQEASLRSMLARSLEAGYNAVGFYLEHRFAYPSAPWAAGPGCLTPALTRKMIEEFAPQGLRIIPFLNTLGHMEGFIRSEGGQWLAEGPGSGSLQMCPSRPECVEFARNLVADAMSAFDDEWVHLGGDETNQLGQCPLCSERADSIGKAGIYAEYFAPLCEWVLSQGRRPCLWGDMLIEHPDVLSRLPKETVIFDWHYGSGPRESTGLFRSRGFDVVCCPAVHTYDSAWCYLDVTRSNIDEHTLAAKELGALGVCVTTWEFMFLTNYASTMPVIYSAGRRIARGDDWRSALAAEGGQGYADAAEILGVEIPNVSAFLKYPGWRRLRDAFVIKQNPLYLWQEWREEACGVVGDTILRLCDDAARHIQEDDPLMWAVIFYRTAVRFVREAESARLAYAAHEDWPKAFDEFLANELAPMRDRAIAIAKEGGSAADQFRIERIIGRARSVSRSCDIQPKEECGAHRPAFETLMHEAYVPGDQAAWRTGQYR
jgi:hypothetical protein